jgi:hypothetical protein
LAAFGKKRKTQNLYLDTDYTDATDFKTCERVPDGRAHTIIASGKIIVFAYVGLAGL